MDVKIIFVGNCGVGKTNLISQLSHNIFIPISQSTIAMDSVKLQISGNNNQKIVMTLWDTAGQQKYRSISKAYFKNAKFIIFVYSVTDSKSFTDIHKWASDAAPYSSLRQAVIAIVANKIDLNKQNRDNEQQARKIDSLRTQLYNQYGVSFNYFELSAKTGQNVSLFKQWLINNTIYTQGSQNQLNNHRIYLSLSSSSIISDTQITKTNRFFNCC